MLWRCLMLVAGLTLAAGNAHAQRIYHVTGPEGVPLTVGPLGPSPTEGEIAQLLRDALTNFDNSNVTVRQGIVRRGDEIATRVMPYEDARRLENDVTRGGALGGRVLLLRAGTPLYFHPFANPAVLSLTGTATRRGLWCGAGADGESGYCLLAGRDAWQVTQIRSDSPYAPLEIGPLLPASFAQLARDPTAMAELPQRTEVYRFGGMRGSRATIARSIRIGEDVVEVADVRLAQMRLGSLMVRMAPGPEPDTIAVSYEALSPADHESDILLLARSIRALTE